MKYLNAKQCFIYILILWWVLWLTVAYFELGVYIRPSSVTFILFMMFIASFVLGHLFVNLYCKVIHGVIPKSSSTFVSKSLLMSVVLNLIILSCLLVLIYSLYSSGALLTSFVDYFLALRSHGLDGNLTGSKYLDILTKIIIFPASYSSLVLTLSIGINKSKFVFCISILNMLLFAYLWQVNYPIIHLFWLTVLYIFLKMIQSARFKFKSLMPPILLIVILALSAVNRFGGDFFGAIQQYFIGYHLIGFSFFDYQFNNPESILHVCSFGRSSLGFIDQIIDLLSRIAGLDYKSASMENVHYNSSLVDVSAIDGREINAFGTFLFGFYRDLKFLGIIIGGFCFGAISTYTLQYVEQSWVCRALLIVLASSWMVGMMVNPIEQSHFWFSIIFIYLMMVLNKSLLTRLLTNQPNSHLIAK